MTNNKRILKNTLLLYVRMFITLGISLFTTRVIFQALGLDNMGIYNLVGGVISMLGFLNGSMSSATQRFLSFELGRKNFNGLKNTFELVLLIHVILAGIVLILSETLGLWFVNTQLVIASERMVAANWVFQTAVISSILGILKVPFTASIMANEKMGIYAYFSLVDVVFKLLIVYALWYIPGDSLIVYAILLLFSGIVDFLINAIYALRKLDECRIWFHWDKEGFKHIFGFSGWNLFGQMTIIGNDQILNILLNWFYGTAVNGARGICLRINGVVAQFVYQFQSALNPPIVKSFANNDLDNTHNLISRGMKLSFLLMMVLSFPFLFETDQILTLWLGESPKYTVWFTRLAIINTMLDSMTGPIVTGVQATGRIKKMQIYTSLILASVLPLSYLILKMGFEPYLVTFSNIIVSLACIYMRLSILEEKTGICRRELIIEAILPCYSAAIIASILPFISHILLDTTVLNTSITCMICIVSGMSCGYFIALDRKEKDFVNSMVGKVLAKIRK